MNPKSRQYPRTLCWDCANCAGRCSWSDHFEPVKGWSAIKDEAINWKGNASDSYTVIKCPEFIEGDPMMFIDKMDSSAVSALYATITKNAITEWESLTKKYTIKELMNMKYVVGKDKLKSAIHSSFVSLVMYFNSEYFENAICAIDSKIDPQWFREKYHVPGMNKKREVILNARRY